MWASQGHVVSAHQAVYGSDVRGMRSAVDAGRPWSTRFVMVAVSQAVPWSVLLSRPAVMPLPDFKQLTTMLTESCRWLCCQFSL